MTNASDRRSCWTLRGRLRGIEETGEQNRSIGRAVGGGKGAEPGSKGVSRGSGSRLLRGELGK